MLRKPTGNVKIVENMLRQSGPDHPKLPNISSSWTVVQGWTVRFGSENVSLKQPHNLAVFPDAHSSGPKLNYLPDF